MTTLQEALDLVKARGVTKVDLKVADLFGRWQHFTLPAHRLNADLIAEGSGFDGSSFRGFQAIHESDMLLMPDLDTAVIDMANDVATWLDAVGPSGVTGRARLQADATTLTTLLSRDARREWDTNQIAPLVDAIVAYLDARVAQALVP